MNKYFHSKRNESLSLLLFIFFSTVGISNAQLAFEPRVPVSTGVNPVWISSGDLDGDNDIDLVTANLLSTTISVLMNNGDTTFAPHVLYTVGSRPIALDLGDIDADSDLDIVCANQNTGDVSMLKNNGNGTFASQISYPFGTSPSSVNLADVDGDNDLDLAVGRGDSILILSNPGNGSFLSPASYYTRWTVKGFAFGDFDNDGDRDIAATRPDDSIAVLKNNGNGSFGPLVAYPIMSGAYPERVALADFDNDGDLDIVTANSSPITTSVLFNNGDATFGTPLNFMTQDEFTLATFIQTADMNRDGISDIVVTNTLVSIIISNGDGTFKTPLNVAMVSATKMPLFVSSSAVADFDGDNDIDIASTSASISGNLVSIALNRPELALFEAPMNYPAGTAPMSIASADFDNDNDPDIVVVNRGSGSGGTFSTFMNNGNGTFTVPTIYAAGIFPFAVDVADFDNDSDIDILVTQGDASYFPLKVFWNNGSGAFPSGTVIDGVTFFASVVFVSHGDIDADGDQDIVTANGGTPNWLVRNNGNHTFSVSQIGFGWPNWDSRLRDIDNDGDSDYIGNAGNSLATRKNNGNGTFSPNVFTDLGYEQLSYAIADLDGDADLDLAASTHSTGVALRMLNDGAGNFTSPVYFADGGGYETKVINGDFDADGDVDLVFASFRTQNVTFMRNDGTGNFDVPIAFTAGWGSRALTAADFDGDGDLDVAVANESSNNFSFLKNRKVSTDITDLYNYIPLDCSLSQNYPNPFNPVTKIRYAIPLLSGYERGVSTTLKVYDVLGKEVSTLVNGVKQPGYYEVDFNASNLASGVYIYRLTSGKFVSLKKMLVIK